jgi:hypothetical protein
MGQVIAVDFIKQTRLAPSGDQQHQDRSGGTRTERESDVIAPPPIDPDAANTGSRADIDALTSVQVRGAVDAPERAMSLPEGCRQMREDSAKLLDAVAELRRSVAELQRLPKLARALCEAAV